jgi:hypothetical protein
MIYHVKYNVFYNMRLEKVVPIPLNSTSSSGSITGLSITLGSLNLIRVLKHSKNIGILWCALTSDYHVMVFDVKVYPIFCLKGRGERDLRSYNSLH